MSEGTDRLQKIFDTMSGRTVRDNADLDALLDDSSDVPHILLDSTDDAVEGDDGLDGYFYLTDNDPFMDR